MACPRVEDSQCDTGGVTTTEGLICMALFWDLFILLSLGYLGGQVADRLKLPPLIGMIGVGMALGPHLLDWFTPAIGGLSEEIRMLALLIILFRAGLGLDKHKILSQGSVAIRLGFLPAVIEASVVAVATRLIFGWPWLSAWLLGWIVCAASPAVIVPMMLYLKSKGYGTDKGIPDLILAGGTMSDATAVTLFGITLAWITGGSPTGAWTLQLATVPVQVIGGVLVGFVGAHVTRLISRSNWVSGKTQELTIAFSVGLAVLFGSEVLPYSGFLAVMIMGFVLLETAPAMARRLRVAYEKVWAVAQIFLFVLIGALVDLDVVATAGARGLAIVLIALVVGRWLGIFASTWRSRLTLGERVFMVIGDMAKATVQAAIGGIPLAAGVAHGETMLAIAVLSILVTAPLGAWGTKFLAPRMLERGHVDPTRVSVEKDYRFLVGIDGTEVSHLALLRAAAIARESDAELIILHVETPRSPGVEYLDRALSAVSDLDHRLEVRGGNPVEEIVSLADRANADYIFLGKSNRSGPAQFMVGSIAQHVLERTEVPVILVDQNSMPS